MTCVWRMPMGAAMSAVSRRTAGIRRGHPTRVESSSTSTASAVTSSKRPARSPLSMPTAPTFKSSRSGLSSGRDRTTLVRVRRCGRVADDETRRELEVKRLEAVSVQQPVQEADRGSSHLCERLTHRRQRRRHDRGMFDVVEADDRQVVRHAQAARSRRLDRADRDVVVEREDRRRRLGEVEEVRCGVSPRDDLGLGFDLQCGIRQDACGRKRSAVAAATILGGHPAARAGDLRDPPVAELEQVPHRLVGTRRVRGRHRRDSLVERHQRVEDHEPVAAVEQPLEFVARLLGQDDQRAVGQAVQPVEHGDLAVVLVAGGGEHDLQIALGERLGRPRQDGREVRRVDERDENADQPGAACGEAAGAPVGGVAVLADDPADEVARFVRDVVAAVEYPRDGGDGHARQVGDLADRETLLVVPAGGSKTVPWLARRWAWSNGNKTLTLNLARNVKWSDGKPLTAADVVYSLTAGRQDKTMDRIGLIGADNNVASIKAKGAARVVIRLKTADSQFIPAILNRQFVVPKHIWSKVKDAATFTNPKPVGSGPFNRVARFTTQDYVLNKNPHYWQAGMPKVACLEYVQSTWPHNFVPNVEKAYEAKDPKHFH